MNVGDLDFEFSDEEDDDVSDGTISDIESDSDSDEESSSSAAFVGKNGRRWCHQPEEDGSPPIIEFDAGNVGPAPHCRSMRTPKEVFLAFLSPDIIAEIVLCTNLYGSRRYGDGWKPVTTNEILSFFAILIAAGRNHQNHANVNDMWTSNGSWRIGFYHICLSKNRFKEVFVCLRTDDVLTRKDRFAVSGDKLEPIRKIFDAFVNNCQKNYIPPKVLTVDERLCLFRGRVSFRVYIKSKPGKYGIKIWVCATATGYVIVCQVYTGKGKDGPEKGQGMRVVKDLVAPFLNTGREVTADNLFSTVELAEYLYKAQTSYTGTMRSNKADIPPEFVSKKDRQPGSFLQGFDGVKTLTSFYERKGKKPVVLITTKHFDEPTAGCKPPVVEYYNQTKGFVDSGDQQTRHTSVSRRSRQWPKKLLLEIIDIATLNSNIIFREICPGFVGGRSEFLRILAEELAIDHIRDRLRTGHLPLELANEMRSFVADFEERQRCDVCAKVAKAACTVCNVFMCVKHIQAKAFSLCKPCAELKSAPSQVYQKTKSSRCDKCSKRKRHFTNERCAKCGCHVCQNCSVDQAFHFCETCASSIPTI